MNLPEFAISLGGSVLLFIVLLCVVIPLTIFFYRTTIPQISPKKKVFLAVLRGLALTLLLFLLFEPLFKLVFRQEQKPVLAVLIDDSESMTIKDRSVPENFIPGERAAHVREFLAKEPFAETAPDVSHFSFASQLKKLEPFTVDSLSFKGEITDLATVFRQLKEIRMKENIQAAILISDGNYIVGRNPAAAADELGIPLYTIGVGDTAEQRDVLIASVSTNKTAYAETRIPVDVRIRSSGIKGEKGIVSLMQKGTVLDRKVVHLQEGTRDYTASLSLEAKEEGMQKYTVSVSSLSNELTEKNNFASFFINVLKTKLRILLIAGAPGADAAAVRQTLSEYPHFTVKALIQKNSTEYYEGTLTSAMIDSADCIVLVGYPPSAAAPSHLQQLRDALSAPEARLVPPKPGRAHEPLAQKKPLLFIGSKSLDLTKLETLKDALPFSWSSPSTNETFVFPSVPENQRAHVLVQLFLHKEGGQGGSVAADAWHQLPPIYKMQTTFRAKPEADVLAFALPTIGLAGRFPSAPIPSGSAEPLVLIRSIARQKSFAITGHGIYRWRLLAQGNPQTEKFFQLLLTNAVRWLTTPDEGKKVRVIPTKEVFTTGESVEITGEVYDEQFRPVDNAEVRIETFAPGGGNQRFETLLQSVGSGRYEGSIEGLGAGDYSFTAKAALDGTTLGEDRGKFSVGQLNVEFLETKMNKPLLEQLAFHTGGAYADLAHAASLIDTIKARTTFIPKEIAQTRELELWNEQFLAAIIVLLLATEWFVRKRSGML